MKRAVSQSILMASVCLAFASCSDSAERLVGEGLIAIQGGTLIDGTGAPPSPNAAIVLSGDLILRVGTVGDFQYPPSADVVDATGMFILPGFVDMHVHPRVGAEDETLRMLLGFGVTTIRIPGVGYESPDSTGIALREATARGSLVGPRIFTGAKIIEGPTKSFPDDVEVTTEEEMRAEVRRQADLGVNLVKLYWNTPLHFIRAAIEEAHARDLQVIGHLRQSSWTEAARAGIDGLVHSGWDGPTWELVAPGEQEALRALPFPGNYHRFREMVDLDAPEFDSLVAALIEHEVTVDPTLVIIQSLYYGDDLSILERLEPEAASPSIHATWGDGWESANPFTMTAPQALPEGKVIWPIAMEIVRRLHESGVNVAAGSDVGMPWITPGVSLHRELELLVEAGIPEAEVILIATRNGARGLGKEDLLGVIAPGLSADLVLLRQDPLIMIQNTRSIETVYLGGRPYDPSLLLDDLR